MTGKMLGRFERRRDRATYTTRLMKRREARQWRREEEDVIR